LLTVPVAAAGTDVVATAARLLRHPATHVRGPPDRPGPGCQVTDC